MREQVAQLGTTGPTDHAPMWIVDERQVLGPAGAGSVINRNNEKVKGSVFLQWPLDESSLAASYVAPRVAMMDALGMSAQILFPNVVGFGGQNFFRISDLELRMAIVQIWNDAMADMQRESGGRLIGMGLLPWWDIDRTVQEIKRIAELGLNGVITNADPQNQGLPDLSESYWDPMWQDLQETNLPMNFHCGASATQRTYNGGSPWPSMEPNSKLAVGSAMLQMANARLVANMILSGLCERFPRLKIVSVESGIGWLPFMLEALDYHADENAAQWLVAASLGVLPAADVRVLLVRERPKPDRLHRADRRGQLHVRDRLPAPHLPVPRAAAQRSPDVQERRRLFPPQGVQRERRTRLQHRPRRALTSQSDGTTGRISTGIGRSDAVPLCR